MKRNIKTKIHIIEGEDLQVGDEFVFAHRCSCECVFKILKRKKDLFSSIIVRKDENCRHNEGLKSGVTFWANVIKV